MNSGRIAEEEIISTWHVMGAAAQGVSHQKLDLPCQDFQGYRVLAGETLLVAVADGAGTAPRSAEGAACAVETSLAALADSAGHPPEDLDGWKDLLCAAFEAARQALVELAEESGEPVRSFATTLTCVIAGQDFLAVGQIGDGAVVARPEGGELFAVTQLQRGEYANETNFLSQENALEEVDLQVIDRPVSALAVMSDGLIRLALKLPLQTPHEPFFQPLFAFAVSAETGPLANERMAAFLNSERVCARTDDDKALVLAVRVPGLPEEGPRGAQEDE